LNATAEEARRLIGAHQGIVSLTHGDRPARVASLSDEHRDWRGLAAPPMGEGVYRLLSKPGQPLRMTEAERRAHPAWGEVSGDEGHPPLRGWLAAPLVGRNGDELGLVQLSDRYKGDFTEADEAMLVEIASHAALAVENLRRLDDAHSAEIKLRRFLDSSLDLVCTITRDGRFSEMSANCRQILGYGPEELIGRPYMDFVHPEDQERTRVEEERIRTQHPSRSFANRCLRRDGEPVYLHWSTVWSSADEVFYCVVRDMTEQVKLEEQLNRAQRLEAVGRLTGGIAHDFNNLLTIILGSAEGLVEGLQVQPSLLEFAQLVQAAGERGAELTSRLLTFARRQPLAPKSIDVGVLIAEIDPLVRSAIGEDIEVKIISPENIWKCHADPTQLESALLNLCINARDAMPDGGELTIEAREVEFDRARVSRSEDIQPGQYVMIAVTDSGEGMSRETIEHAFEPFFTTKSAGQGSGLGLSMVYGFINQSGGHVKIYSELGHGTSVRLYLPRTQVGHAPVKERKAAYSPTGSEHVLVVEDDELVRGHVAKQLRSLGYRVSVASEGKSALEMLDLNEDIALLFTDVVMPGMNGRQLAENARVRRPALRLLYTSGYTEDAVLHRGRIDSGVQLLNKPYRKLDLAVKVREALDAV
jgi:PAS domain S-box-containing protein